jgi:putative ABC transport system permease protein
VLLRPLPYANPDRLVFADVELRRRDVKSWRFSNANFYDFRNGAKTTIEDLATVYTGRTTTPREDGAPEQIRFASVTPNFFRLYGARIAFGRDFAEADGEPQPPEQQAGGVPGAQGQAPLPTIAILSYQYWQQRYGGSTAILGNRMMVGGSGGPLVSCRRGPSRDPRPDRRGGLSFAHRMRERGESPAGASVLAPA